MTALNSNRILGMTRESAIPVLVVALVFFDAIVSAVVTVLLMESKHNLTDPSYLWMYMATSLRLFTALPCAAGAAWLLSIAWSGRQLFFLGWKEPYPTIGHGYAAVGAWLSLMCGTALAAITATLISWIYLWR
jgi:hypothetical protein